MKLTLVYEQTAYRSTENVIFLACVFLEPMSQGEQNAPSLSETFFLENCSYTRVKLNHSRQIKSGATFSNLVLTVNLNKILNQKDLL